ncbi:MAG: hypothetical protein AVDCRST_MAG02-3455, partial [uncultured Rubrobacteraceae bacterium]
ERPEALSRPESQGREPRSRRGRAPRRCSRRCAHRRGPSGAGGVQAGPLGFPLSDTKGARRRRPPLPGQAELLPRLHVPIRPYRGRVARLPHQRLLPVRRRVGGRSKERRRGV